MSQLNNENNSNEIKNETANSNKNSVKTKKKHSGRNNIIFLLIFTLICAGVTTFLILTKKDNENVVQNGNENQTQENKTSSSQVVSDGLGLKSLDDTYKGNNLEIKKLSYTDGSTNKYNRKQVEVNYVQINGLKDKNIEANINKEIKDTVDSMRAKYGNDVESLDIEAECTANFENVLSVRIGCYVSYSQGKSEYSFSGLNYDLATGNKIDFKDLFTSDAPIKTILSKAAYDSYVMEVAGSDSDVIDDNPVFYGEKDYGANIGFDPVKATDFSEIEDKVFKVMAYYNNGNAINYSFSPRTISVFINNDRITIPIKSYYSYISIYNRFKGNNDLYDGVYSAYIENNQIPVLLPTNNSGVSLDIVETGGPSGIAYINTKKSGNELIYITANSVYSEEAKGLVLDKKVMSLCMNKVKDLVKQYDDTSKEKLIYIEVYGEPYRTIGEKIGDYSISVTEYTKKGNSKGENIVTETIRALQDGNPYFSYLMDENPAVEKLSHIWIYYKDTNTWKEYSENDAKKDTKADTETDSEENYIQTNTETEETIWPEYEGM